MVIDNATIAVLLFLLAIVLFLAVQFRLIGDEVLQRLTNVAGTVAAVAAILVFVIPAIGDDSSPSATPTAAFIESTQIATSTSPPDDTPTVAIATATFTSVPPTNTPFIPTATDSPTQEISASCQVDGPFSSIWQEYKTQLGCNRSIVQIGSITVEAFQGGYLVWIKAEDRIYAIQNNGDWSVYPNSWVQGENSLPCERASSIGYPAMGFGKLWCNDSTVNGSLGTPLDKEKPDDNAQRQIFENGQILRAHNGITFVLLNDGTGRVV